MECRNQDLDGQGRQDNTRGAKDPSVCKSGGDDQSGEHQSHHGDTLEIGPPVHGGDVGYLRSCQFDGEYRNHQSGCTGDVGVAEVHCNDEASEHQSHHDDALEVIGPRH